jgi:hypothetical protein
MSDRLFIWIPTNEDMIPKDTTIDYKVRLFLCLHNDISKNLLLPNIVTFSVLRNNDDDDANIRKNLSMVSTR